jgi:hypothetical protein
MTTSSSTNFATNRDSLISGALRLAGALSLGETPTADQVTEANETLNMLVKALQVDGMPLWAIKETTIPLSTNVSSISIGLNQSVNTPKPLKILQAYVHDINSNVDIPMRIITRDLYNRLGNKTTNGSPVQLYYDVQREYGTIFIFPVPSSLESSTKNIKIVYQRPFEDFDSSTDEPDFPQEWFEAVKYGLATRLAGEYGIPLEDRKQLLQEYILIKNEALGFGTEEGSFYIVPRDN